MVGVGGNGELNGAVVMLHIFINTFTPRNTEYQ